MSTVIYEGWTAQDFVDELYPTVDMIMTGKAIQQPFKNKQELSKWLIDNQPYYKKRIPKVEEFFSKKYNLK